MVIGECSCFASSSTTSTTTSTSSLESCNEAPSRFLYLSGKSASLSSLFFGGVSLLLDMRTFYLLECLDIIQYFGNLALLETKGIGPTPAEQRIFFDLSNPTFFLLQDDAPSKQQRSTQLSVLNTFRAPIISSPILRAYDILDIIVYNPLQSTPHFQASLLLKNHSQALLLSDMSSPFLILTSIICAVSLLFHTVHATLLKKIYYPSIATTAQERVKTSVVMPDNSSSSSSSSIPSEVHAVDSRIKQYKQETLLESIYLNSRYFRLQVIVTTFFIVFVYAALNEQMLYLQVAATLHTLSGFAATMVFFVLALFSLSTVCLSRQPTSHLVKESIVIFDGIVQQGSCLQRNISVVKVAVKVLESLVFYQLADAVAVQCAVLAVMGAAQIGGYYFLQPFGCQQYNVMIVVEACVKTVVPIMYLIQTSADSSRVTAVLSLIIGWLQMLTVLATCVAPLTNFIPRTAILLSNWFIARRNKVEEKKKKRNQVFTNNISNSSNSSNSHHIVELTKEGTVEGIASQLQQQQLTFPGSPTDGQQQQLIPKGNQSTCMMNNLSSLFAETASTLFENYCGEETQVGGKYLGSSYSTRDEKSQSKKQKEEGSTPPSAICKEITILMENQYKRKMTEETATATTIAVQIVVTDAAECQVGLLRETARATADSAASPQTGKKKQRNKSSLLFRAKSSMSMVCTPNNADFSCANDGQTPIDARILINQRGGGFTQITEILEEDEAAVATALKTRPKSLTTLPFN